MRIAILGTGVMGSALAARLTRSGHDVISASRKDNGYRDAVAASELAFLAVTWPHSLDAVRRAGDFGGRVLVDVSNPETTEGIGLEIGHSTSGAEEIARQAGGARVVKAFSHVYAEVLRDTPPFDGDVPSVLYCGDDDAAKAIVRRIIESCGFDGVDAGPLCVARFLEPFAMLTVQLVRGQGLRPAGAVWKLMRA